MADSVPQASVVIPTHNRADVLRASLDSVLAQDTPDYEAIYVDDASTDGTAAILAEYAVSHPGRLRAVQLEENVGPGPARNAGVCVARGAYLLFTDDDAVVPQDWVRGMLACCEARSCDVLCGGIAAYSLETPVERYLHHRMQTRLGPEARPVGVAPTGNLMMPRDLFMKVGGFCRDRLDAAEDWELCHRLRAAGATIFYDPSAAVAHRYQSAVGPALARMRATGAAGVAICAARYGSVTAYVGYSVLRFLASPVWLLWRYPLGLYPLAWRMEAAFCGARVTAYVRHALAVSKDTAGTGS